MRRTSRRRRRRRHGRARSAAPSPQASPCSTTIPIAASRRPSARSPSRPPSATRPPRSARPSRCRLTSAPGAPTSTYPGTGTTAEIDLLAGLKLKALSDKLTFDLGYIRYNYLSAPASLFYDFNEFGLVAGYDFGVAQLQGAVRYSPNFFANSGIAWYKWAQVTVPLPFIKVNENIAFKAFANIGNQYVERFTNYGIPSDNYWDWQIGLTVNVYGFDLTAAYTDTNVDVVGCANTYNCEGRIIVSIGKTF